MTAFLSGYTGNQHPLFLLSIFCSPFVMAVSYGFLSYSVGIMATIVIDARELRTSTGRYVERLLHYLQKIDHEHEYHVLLKPADMASWQPTNQRFFAVACPVKEFTVAEQTTLKKQIEALKPDLVHFAMTQ